MSLTDPTPTLPPFAQRLLTALMQKGLTIAATALTGYGVISSDQTAGFVSIGLSMGLWAISFVWTYTHEKHAHAALAAAINAKPPAVPVQP